MYKATNHEEEGGSNIGHESAEIVFEARNLGINAVRDDGSELSIVKDINFSVRRGEVVALIGESGSGKTTVSLSALGYCKRGLRFAQGKALLYGEDLSVRTTAELRDIRGVKVAYLAQSAAATFNPSITINEQVTEAPVRHGQKKQSEADEIALELYEALDLPEPDKIGARYPHQVSGGQLQRLMAAMALCGDPDLLIFDEPTTALDVTTQIEVLKAFKKVVKKRGAAAIYVTHDLAIVAQIADQIVVLYDGEIKEAGTASSIINHPQHPYTRKLIAAINPLSLSTKKKITLDDDRPSAPVLEARNIFAGYGSTKNGLPVVRVLHDINVTIERGKTVGIIGESGCGKSTLARVFAGLLPPYSGLIKLDGKTLEQDLKCRSREELRKMQFVYQMADTALNPKHKIETILGRPVKLYSETSVEETRKRVAHLLEMVELPKSFMNRLPHELSGGQKQRVNLARALAANPAVVLCDEVTSALDTIVAANVIELLKHLRKETGVSFVFISHDLSTVSSFADQVVVLYAGRVVEQGNTYKVLAPPYHPYTQMLIESVPEPRIGWLDQISDDENAMNRMSAPVNMVEKGCPFFGRCGLAIPTICNKEDPPQRIGDGGHVISCHREISEL